MPVLESDIVPKLTTKSGSAGATLTSTPAASLGKYVSITNVDLSTILNNIIRDITAAESAAGITIYRAIAIQNNSGTDSWTPTAWLPAGASSGGVSVAIGVDPAAASDKDSASAQGAEIANETTAPVGVTFSSPTTSGGAISLGAIAVDFVKFLWIRVTVTPGSGPISPYAGTIRLQGNA